MNLKLILSTFKTERGTIFNLKMNTIIADNFPSEEYEFITSHYSEPHGAKCQHDANIYKDTRFYNLILCPHCKTIVALYNETWWNTPQTYDSHWQYTPRNHLCNVRDSNYPLLKGVRRYYCVPYPHVKW